MPAMARKTGDSFEDQKQDQKWFKPTLTSRYDIHFLAFFSLLSSRPFLVCAFLAINKNLTYKFFFF